MRAKFGIDAPGVVRTLALLGVALGVLAWPVFALLRAAWGGAAAVAVSAGLALTALTLLTQSVWMVYSSLVAKHRLWHRTLDGLALRGDERVLEVGPGRGAVLLRAARHVPRGHLVGVDLWRAQDQSGNGRAALLANARAAGVADRVEVLDGDMRDLPFPAAEFDLALAGLAIHNLPAGERARAVGELLRVVRPGGRVVILDFEGTAGYADALRQGGADAVHTSARHWSMHPPVRLVTATAPAARP
ncbi:methyltransferase domain-containing protein [Dactylosporangium vinaceum]|uniref:Class I SAM-dependent methyltransferase n=1 Tax=Dactylosporangium vinaceum TaxID=53362 RepID=A0ABV5MS40_9ACTN|nr:methyltransferase domain-containing protein [Dactylosporangium vinaceum]UAC00251.1 methyltransferase domain-containing protein [Dactylosporangium vinaceum]